jgi:hypothetical protein
MDYILSQKDDEAKEKAASVLLTQLQNPALILHLLSQSKSNNFIKQQLEVFMKQYTNKEDFTGNNNN